MYFLRIIDFSGINKLLRSNRQSLKGTVPLLITLFFILPDFACKKLVQINEPYNSITTSQTFSNDANANAAVMGIYNDMINAPKYSSQDLTIYSGMSADEIGTVSANDPLQLNSLLPDNGAVNALWTKIYFTIFLTNSTIEGLYASSGVSENLKKQLIGEAKFIRAFCYFYLVNLYGDVPLLTTASWPANYLLKRESKTQIYEQIVADLNDAKAVLPVDYSTFNNERIRVTKWAAAALLARVYLYVNQYNKAEDEATLVIEKSDLYTLDADLNEVFKKNTPEAIWQLQPVYTSNVTNYVAPEPNTLIPPDSTSVPTYIVTSELLKVFESGDQRRNLWIGRVVISPDTFYYPSKYKVSIGVANVVPTEYYMVLRLAEQYLIRAEARVRQDKLSGAITDLNTIRSRAMLPNLSASLTKSEVLAAISQENRIEFFTEWGHRWFDLKRTGQADVVLGQFKGSVWQTTDQFYPIPLSEIQRNPNLSQNAGY